MSIQNPEHPVWKILASTARLSLLMLSLIIVLVMNAEHFDDTELKSIVTMFLVAAGAEGGGHMLVGRFFGGNKTNTDADA